MRGHEILIAAMWAPAVLAFGAMAIAPLGPQGAPAAVFPKPDRPVADIVSPIWDNRTDRDAAREVSQIAMRLDLKPGMSVAISARAAATTRSACRRWSGKADG